MHRVRLQSLNDFAEWRDAARGLLIEGVHPDEVVWEDPSQPIDLFAEPEDRPADVASAPVGVVPPKFIELAEAAICHREAVRFALLYRLLFRLQKDRELIEVRSDPDVSRLYRLAGEVRRDSHKMKAFVRFQARTRRGSRRGSSRTTTCWSGRRRFSCGGSRRCSGRSLRRTGRRPGTARRLLFGDGTRREDAPRGDAMEDMWRTYFASIFNPARLKVQMMKSEMPVKYWRNLPEAELIPSLIRGAKEAEAAMIAQGSDRATGAAHAGRRRARSMPGGGGDRVAGRCAGGRAGLHALPALRARDAGGVRRRAGDGRGDVRRRAAGRPGGSGGPAVRRAGRAGVRPGARKGRDRRAAGSTSPMR